MSAAILAMSLLAAGAPVEVAVSGIQAARGLVHVDICPETLFLTSDCPFVAETPATAGTTIVTVPNVPPGRYAAQAFHDVNGNHKVDFNFLGLPIERIGFSNDVMIHLARPKFAAAAFEHGTTPQRIGLTVRKLP